MNSVPLWRLYLLRAAYLLIAVSLTGLIWPLLLSPPPDLAHPRGVMWALLGGVAVLAAVGIRHPLRMLPLLLFELTWKSIWLVLIALPRWSAGTLDAAMTASIGDCVFGVVLTLVVIPWGYVLDNYVRRPGEPWRRPVTREAR